MSWGQRAERVKIMQAFKAAGFHLTGIRKPLKFRQECSMIQFCFTFYYKKFKHI